ncbi:unnamed protein product, partial [Adineta steineri]
TNQQQSSPPLILPTLKRKENEQITLLTSLAQLTTSSHVWQQYFHTRQILPMKNYEEYFDNFSLYKFHLSPSWYESKDSSIQRLANRIPTHPLLGIRQLNDQTSATWKNHKIQDAILFPAVVYLELATAACHQLLSSKEDDQQQPTIIFEDVNFTKALIFNEHELMEVFTQIIMPMREWYIIFCNQANINKYSLNEFTLHAHDITSAYQYGSSFQKTIKTLRGTSTTIISQLSNNNNNCSSYYFLHPYLVLLLGIETTFLPVSLQEFIYSSKTKTKRISQQISKIWTDSPTIKHISHLLPSPNQILNNQLNSISNQDLAESIEPFNELATYYAQMAIKDLDLNQQHHPLLNACCSLASTLHLEQVVTWHSTHPRLIQLIERFPRLKPFLIILNKYDSHLKDILSGEKNGLDIFLGDNEIGENFRQIKTLIRATKIQQIIHWICQHLQLQYEQTKDDSFENYRLRIFWLTDSGCSDVLPILDLLLNLSQQTVHIPLYFDLIFCFFDQWWPSSDDNNRALNNIQQWTTLLEQIEGSNIIESTLNQNESTLIICQKTTSNEILQRLNERKNQTWLIFTKDDNNSFSHILSSLLPCSNIEMFDIRHSTLDTICFGISVLLTTYKQVSIIFAWQLDQVALNENNDDLAFKQNEELISGPLSLILRTIQKSSPYFYPFVYVLTDHAQFNNDSNLNIIPSPFIGLARSLITEYERHRL